MQKKVKVILQTLPQTPINIFITTLQYAIDGITDADIITDPEFTCFHATSEPSISIEAYIQRLVMYAPCTVECFVVAMTYLNRIRREIGEFYVNPMTIHRLLITALLIAGKYCDDLFYNNKYYAQLGGIPRNEMNLLEMEMFELLSHNCHVTESEFSQLAYLLTDYPASLLTKRNLQIKSQPNLLSDPKSNEKISQTNIHSEPDTTPLSEEEPLTRDHPHNRSFPSTKFDSFERCMLLSKKRAEKSSPLKNVLMELLVKCF
jgi:hypothetical protein